MAHSEEDGDDELAETIVTAKGALWMGALILIALIAALRAIGWIG